MVKKPKKNSHLCEYLQSEVKCEDNHGYKEKEMSEARLCLSGRGNGCCHGNRIFEVTLKSKSVNRFSFTD